jgi:hypothetical protein
MQETLLDVSSLRRRAMQCRKLADGMTDLQIAARMRLIADDYDNMALSLDEPSHAVRMNRERREVSSN